jgi:hypothetical protein
MAGILLKAPTMSKSELLGVLTAVYSDSHHSFKDPALPGFRF